MTEFTEIKNSDLASKTEVEASTITTRLLGNAETSAMTELAGYLGRLHTAAIGGKIGEVVIDMRALEFMNSSCFKTFVAWIGQLQEEEPGAQYKVRFVSDEKKHWQSRSLGALACFAVDLIRVESS
jgi:hypothetical protein